MCRDRAGQPFQCSNHWITDTNQLPLEGIKMKTCTKCGNTKSTTEFHKRARGRDGLQAWCILCIKIIKSDWQPANPEKVNAHAAKYRAANHDSVNAAAVERYAADPEKHIARVVKWQAENQESVRIHKQNRRARERKAAGKLSQGLAERLFILQRGKCPCCRKPLGDNYHRDHRMPLALGGTNTDDNMQLLCATCNLQKHAKHPIDFMQQKGFLI